MKYGLQELLDLINKTIENFEWKKEPGKLYDPLRYTLSQKGKRIRPLMVLIAYQLYRDDCERVVLPALAVEMFHNFTLIHDDIMDNAPLRRNMPTVMKKWNINVAILSGDQMLLEAYKLLLKVDHRLLPAVLDKFNHIATQVCEGQQWDMDFEDEEMIPVFRYLKMIEAKTSVLLGYSLWLGAMLGGSTVKDADRLFECGKNMGIAFQLQDDYLDLYGNSGQTGKRVGGDLLAGKKTYPVIKAFDIANHQDKQILLKCLHDRSLDDNFRIKTVLDIMHKYDVKSFVEDKIKDYMSLSWLLLDKLPVDPARKKNMFELMEMLQIRKS